MSDNYTPSIDTARECFVDGAAGEFIAEDFDRVLESVRAEERARIARNIEAHEAERRRLGLAAPKKGRIDPHSFAYEHAARIAREGS